MRAIVYEKYGAPEVLQIEEVPRPSPGEHEVLIKVHAVTASSGDSRVRSLELPAGFGLMGRLVFGVRRPRQQILGADFAGEVVAVGKQVRRFQPGDAVFGLSGMKMGSYAEYKVMPEGGPLALKPPGLSFEEAAALAFGGTTALDFFWRGKLRSGERLLINGASGAVGTAAIQLARHFGARVTAVCSAANAELVRSLGADEVIDYTSEDFTRNGQVYDVIMDTAGTAPFSRCRRSLAKGGRLLLVLGSLPQLLSAPILSLVSGRRVVAGPSSERPEDLRFLAELAGAGKLRPVIDRRYPFEQMAEAHRYVGTGRKRGNVVVSLAPPVT